MQQQNAPDPTAGINLGILCNRGIAVLLISLLTIALVSCSEGALDEPSADAPGEVVIGLTDAESDFTGYWVDVVSLTLTKQSGAVVDALPMETRVNFAEYVDMTEFLTAATVPSGRYVEATVTLDYQNAEIWIPHPDPDNDDDVQVETILEEDGQPITALDVTVHLEGRNALVVAPGIPAHLTLDFDLSASNQVEFDNNDDPTLTVSPVLTADLNPVNPKIHRLRGPLREVDVDEGTFRVIIRPFVHILSGGDERFGTLQGITDGNTYFDINGEQYQGSAGLVVLSEQQDLTAVVAIGDLDIASRRFEATQVHAGSSVPGGALDVVTGNVVRRSGNQLTVRGANLIRSQGSVVFNNVIDVLLGENTVVSRQHSTASYTIDDISVGQRISAFGLLNAEETALDTNLSGDDVQGHARMLYTTIKGTVVAKDSTVFVDLIAIDGRRIGHFDFSSTGSSGDDADPEGYEVDPQTLDVSGLVAGTPVKFRGFVTPFGHLETDPDFEAVAMVNVTHVKGLLVVSWFPASAYAIAELSADAGITLNLDGVLLFHHLNRAGVVTDLTQLGIPPIIEPEEDGSGLFKIVENVRPQLFFSFDGFVSELEERLEDTANVEHISATGTFDDATATLTSALITVKLK